MEKHYQFNKKHELKDITPLILDLTNPSPSIGWANDERPHIDKRGNPDCIMALALIHHLAISNNLPFVEIASYFSRLGKYLIIEFVPKEDSKVQKLLSTREDIFTHYEVESFEKVFGDFYEILIKNPIQMTNRTLYLMKQK